MASFSLRINTMLAMQAWDAAGSGGTTAPIPVFIIAGQSNAEGGADLGDRTGLPALAPLNLTRAMPGTPIWNATTTQFETLREDVIGVGNQYGYIAQQPYNAYFGPELAVADLMDRAGRQGYILKYAYGGTAIEVWMSGQPKRLLLDKTVKDGLAAIKAANPGRALQVTMLWGQGESNNGDSAAAYQAKLKAFFDSCYADWLPAEARIALTLLRAQFDTNGQVRAGQVAYAATNPYVTCLIPDAWEARTDVPIHYNGNGQYAQGKAFYEVANGTYVPPTSGGNTGGGTTPTTPEILIQETDAQWKFTPDGHPVAVGYWRADFNPPEANGGTMYFVDPGFSAVASRAFTGDALNIYAPGMTNGRVQFEAWVDGILRGSVNINQGASTSVVRLALRGLGVGDHVLEIRAIASYNAFGIVDAIGVYGPQSNPSQGGGYAVSTEPAFTDAFSGNTLDARWQPDYYSFDQVMPVVQNGQVTFTPALGDAQKIGGITSAGHDFRGRAVSVQLVSALANTAPSGATVFTTFEIGTGPGASLRWILQNGNLTAQLPNYQQVASMAYDPAVHKYLRIKDNAGTISWDYSTDGVTYTSAATAPTSMSLLNVSYVLGVGSRDAGNTDLGTAAFDDVSFV